METLNSQREKNQTPKLRAIVEIGNNGELQVIPIAQTDADEKSILQALRVFAGGS
jgi:hypothetical protein